MRLVKNVELPKAPCPCRDNLRNFLMEFGPLGVGSIVECDCGKHYVLGETAGVGFWWTQSDVRQAT